MKKILLSGLVICFSIALQAQNVGIGTDNPLAKLSVGTTSQFRVDVDGNITRIRDLQYSFPSSHAGAGFFLRNDGAGNLTWSAVTLPTRPVVRTFTVMPNGFTSWFIDNPGDYNNSPFNSNPTLVLYRGMTYQFNVSAPGHPFRIATTSGGPAYNVGVVNNDEDNGVVLFTVPMDAPNNLAYYCTIHAFSMFGSIIVR